MLPSSGESAGPRLAFLDGLRGWMAFAVLLAHLLETWLLHRPQLEDQGLGWLVDLGILSPLRWMMDGILPVIVFFAISGVALAYPILRSASPYRTLAGMAAWRYPRLAVPALLSCLLVYALVATGTLGNKGLPGLDIYFSGLKPELGDVFQEALWQAFTVPRDVERSWNPVLWTMVIEITGSFLLFLFIAIVPWRNPRLLVGAALIVLARDYYIAGFFGGYFVAELLVAVERSPDVRAITRRAQPIGWLLLAAALALAILIERLFNHPREWGYIPYLSLVALFAMIGVALTPASQRMLSTRVSRFLGRISFGLYLTHLSVLALFSSALFRALPVSMPYLLKAALVGVLSTIAAIAAGYVFTVLVEERLLPRLKRPIVAATSLLWKRFATAASAGRS